jgi:hypothetical protein
MNTMLHLGLGSFHRAHQGVYLHELIKTGDTSWTLAGGNTRPDMAETLAALAAQGGAYTLETISPAGEHRYERITSIRKVIPYAADLAGLIAEGASPATKIISFTVTEAGYYLDAKNRLDLNFADLAADLQAAKAGRPGPHDLRRADGDPARAPRRGRRAGDAAELRQPAPQRRPFAQRPAAVRSTALGDSRPARLGAGSTRPAPTRWSTASRRARRPRCASVSRPPPASTTPAGDGRELHPVGDRGPTSPPAGRPGRRWACRWSIRCCPTRKPRSACSTPRTAASPGPARCVATVHPRGARTTPIRRSCTTTSPTTPSPACSPARSTWRPTATPCSTASATRRCATPTSAW